MAKILNKDPAVYTRERDGFVRDLQHFHDTRGTKFRRIPLINGRPIDLYLLYNVVTAKGGWVKVTHKNEWDSLLEHFALPTQCVNSGVALKQIYIRYLDRYEKVHFLGEEADRGSDDDEDSRHKRWSARAMHSVPLSYNHHQHNIAESMRSFNGLSADLYKPSDYDRLLLALLCPLPNEQDFAINVCTLLSNEGKHHLKLEKCAQIVDYLLAHAGVFHHSSLRPLFSEVYSNVRKQSLNSFWTDTVVFDQFIDLIDESKFSKRKTVLPSINPIVKRERPPSAFLQKKEAAAAAAAAVGVEVAAAASDKIKEELINQDDEAPCCSKDLPPNIVDDRLQTVSKTEPDDVSDHVPLIASKRSDSDDCSDDSEDSDLFAPDPDTDDPCGGDGKQKVKLKLEPGDRELFCTGRTLGTQEYVGQRVLQVANILRNLSFTEENVPYLASNITFLRFLLLCTSARWNSIHQHGFDMLSNIAGDLLVKDPVRDRLSECLLTTITQGLSSEDRFVIISCLDVLNKLCQNEVNEDVLLRHLDQNVYEQVCTFLTIHDIMLLVYTLECLYALSSLGERACNNIVSVHGVIDVLVALITVEAQSYGPKACIGMKVIETVPTGTSLPPPQQPTTSTTIPSTPVATTSTTLVSSTPNTVSTITTSNIMTPSIPYSTPSTPSATPVPRTIVPPNSVITPPKTFITSTPSISQPAVSLPQPSPPSSSSKMQMPTVQQQHAHQQAIQENEHFALAWLRANYELDPNAHVEQQELYRNYLNSCSKIGRKGVIAPLHFPRCVRSTFGGTVGPNQGKNDTLHYYEGIKLRAQPLILNSYIPIQQNVQSRPSTPVKSNKRSKTQPNTVPVLQTVTTVVAENATLDIMATPPPSPASPILKAQLSTPVRKESPPLKQEPGKSQVSAHPHLSQALLGTGAASAVSSSTTSVSKEQALAGNSITTGSQSSSSLIKSLLATKVNDCMTISPSMRTTSVVTTDCSLTTAPHAASVVNMQVTQRQQQQQQQRLLAQQLQATPSAQPVIQTANKGSKSPKNENTPKNCRINGARNQSNELIDNLSSTGNGNDSITTSVINSRLNRSPQAVPPLAPLSTVIRQAKLPKIDIEDSDSTGNNSLASSSGLGSSQIGVNEDGDNSLTSFEGLLTNGIPNSIDIDAPTNDDNNSNVPTSKHKSHCLMLADLLEKKIDKKEPPLMNGVLRIGEKGLELVENHLEKALLAKESAIVQQNDNAKVSVIVPSSDSESSRPSEPIVNNVEVNSVITNKDVTPMETMSASLKRPLEEPSETQAKRPHTSSVIVANSNVNGTVSNSEDVKTVSNGEETEGGSVSSTAANLYAALAADVLDEEDLEEATPPTVPVQVPQIQPHFTPVVQTAKVVNAMPQPTPAPPPPPVTQQLIVTNRQMVVSQPQVISTAGAPMILTASGQLIQQGTAVAGMHNQMPVLVQTGAGGQQRMVYSQVPQGVQILGTQTGQYVISSGNAAGQTTYVMAQPQTAIVQGQAQTVLVAQTATQQGTPSKTIIILQPQAPNTQGHQKVVVTPQAQSVVMAQVPRPIVQTSTITNTSTIISTPNQIQPTVITSNFNVNPTTSVVRNVAASPSISTAQINVQNSLNKTVISTCTVTVAQPVVNKVIINSGPTKLGTQTTTTTGTVVSSVNDNKQLKASVNNTCVKQSNVVQKVLPPDALYVCEWRGCNNRLGYKSANEVLLHAVDAHCPNGTEEIQCMWDSCDNMKRKRLSLMTHLMDRHCNLEAMKIRSIRRQMSQSGRNDSTSTTPQPHPGYAPDAALHAIKRHALEFVNPKELLQQRNEKQTPAVAAAPPTISSGPPDQMSQEPQMDDNEGPVTKSIRLTASLILRNLVIYSNNSRRFLRHYEPHLANVALSNVESSRTIAQVLYDMNDNSSRR